MDISMNAPTKYLSFTMNDTWYAIHLSNIQEIQSLEGLRELTIVKDAPKYFKGMAHIHNSAISIIDLRLFYGLPGDVRDDFSVVIILKLENKLFGIIVDSVSDIIEFEDEKIQDPPDFFDIRYYHCVQGVSYIEQTMYIILDVQKILTNEKNALSKYVEVTYG